MLKHKEMETPGSCFNKAFMDETIFVLLARDPATPHAIREWVKERIRLGKNTMDDNQIREALRCAGEIEREPYKP